MIDHKKIERQLVLVRNDMDVNEHERLSSITLRHKVKQHERLLSITLRHKLKE